MSTSFKPHIYLKRTPWAILYRHLKLVTILNESNTVERLHITVIGLISYDVFQLLDMSVIMKIKHNLHFVLRNWAKSLITVVHEVRLPLTSFPQCTPVASGQRASLGCHRGAFLLRCDTQPLPLFCSSLLLCLWTQSERHKREWKSESNGDNEQRLFYFSMNILHYGKGEQDREVTKKKGKYRKRRRNEKEKRIKFCPITAGAEA